MSDNDRLKAAPPKAEARRDPQVTIAVIGAATTIAVALIGLLTPAVSLIKGIVWPEPVPIPQFITLRVNELHQFTPNLSIVYKGETNANPHASQFEINNGSIKTYPFKRDDVSMFTGAANQNCEFLPKVAQQDHVTFMVQCKNP